MIDYVSAHRHALPLMLLATFATCLPATAEVDVSGRVSVEIRSHPEPAAHPGQRSHASGIAAEATVYIEDDEGRSFTLTPFFRFDAGDSDRSHADLREAYYLLYGDIGDSEWELRLGIDRVFWGVVESRPLVDIVNQTDLVEHPNEKTKLGQPMAYLTLSGGWGTLELLGLTWHRPRTFPGPRGRLRGQFVVNPDLISYESTAEEWNVDLATRYSNSFGPFDIGLSLFDGTSRDPLLLPVPADSVPTSLAPHYEQIRQFGLDAQLTTGPWLFKLEAIRRTGAETLKFEGEGLKREEEDYNALVVGGEYTISGVMDSYADLTMFVEWLHDGRDRWTPHPYENDIFAAARLALNDEHDTEFVLSSLSSVDTSTRVLGAEFRRRLSDSWSLHAEASAYLEVDEKDIPVNPVRRDSFIAVNLDYSF